MIYACDQLNMKLYDMAHSDRKIRKILFPSCVVHDAGLEIEEVISASLEAKLVYYILAML